MVKNSGGAGCGKAGCKWCALGECWGRGGVQKTSKGKGKGGGGGSGMKMGGGMMGGMGGGNPVAALLQMMMGGAGGMGGFGGGGGKKFGGGGGGNVSKKSGGKKPEATAKTGDGKSAKKLRAAANKLESIGGAAACTPQEVKAFLAENPELEKHAVAKFKSLNAKLQKLVIQRGDMSEANDKTAVLMARIRNCSRIKDGDWICPACNDLQFAKNDVCRKCSTAKP